MSRLLLTRAASHTLRHYGESTRRAVDEVATALESLFWIERSGETSPAWAVTLERLFALWCEQGGVVPADEAASVVEKLGRTTVASLTKTVEADLGFTGPEIEVGIIDYVAAIRAGVSGRRLSRARQDLLRVLYRTSAHALCVQSAHVTLARAVLYRVLEDKGLAGQRISGSALDQALDRSHRRLIGASTTPGVQLLEDMRRDSEAFLPLLFALRELDWWQIPTPREDRQLHLFDQYLAPVDVAVQRMLKVLDGYEFSDVDHDVWKDVYQYHLPWDERQRLGSFYTPDAMVDLTLDLAGWEAGEGQRIAEMTLADLSCGSGAFLVEALRRRRLAMEQRGENRLGSQPTPVQLDELMEGIVGFDIHPFASFLASVNLVFQVIDLYDSVRHRHPDYSLPVNVFTVDSLEDDGVHSRQASLQAKLPEDIRIRHTEREIARYRQLRAAKFDVVVGNPPWGTVLKGKLSPLNDPQKRKEYRTRGRFVSATGKFDIYVLFIERSVRWLKPEGCYAMVVPNTYLDRDFGTGIRGFLAEHAPPKTIVDFGPFGELFFRAMNTPSVLAGSLESHTGAVEIVMLSPSFVLDSSDRESRQGEVVAAAQHALTTTQSAIGVTAFGERTAMLSSGPWHLDPLAARRDAVIAGAEVSGGSVFKAVQGVTTGGEGVLRLLRMTESEANELDLDSDLLRPAVGGVDVPRWSLCTSEKVLVYPYTPSGPDGEWRPAFVVAQDGAAEWDALTPRPLDRVEERLVSGLREEDARLRLVMHRIAIGQCPFPQTALYLMDHFEKLAARGLGPDRPWYDFHRAREPEVMTAKPKILARRYAGWPTYALDEVGFVPSDKCMALWRPPSRIGDMGRLIAALASAMGRRPTYREVLVYSLAFLNSSASAFLLRVGRKATAKGSWTLTENAIGWVGIKLPVRAAFQLLQDAEECVRQASVGSVDLELELDIDRQVLEALQLDSATRRDVAEWALEHRPGS